MRAAITWAVRFRMRDPTALWRRLPLWLLARLFELVYLVTGRTP